MKSLPQKESLFCRRNDFNFKTMFIYTISRSCKTKPSCFWKKIFFEKIDYFFKSIALYFAEKINSAKYFYFLEKKTKLNSTFSSFRSTIPIVQTILNCNPFLLFKRLLTFFKAYSRLFS